LIGRNVGIRNVYGEPVQCGDVTVIPVAKVAFGFGAGGGRGPARKTSAAQAPDSGFAEAEGGGGGGGARMTPVGALEIGPHGTRFVYFHEWLPLVGAAAAGLALGLLLAGKNGRAGGRRTI